MSDNEPTEQVDKLVKELDKYCHIMVAQAKFFSENWRLLPSTGSK